MIILYNIIKNITTLTIHDLSVSIKNKTIYLIFFIPFFIFLSLNLIDTPSTEFRKINIGLIENEIYPDLIIKSIKSSDKLFNVSRVSNENEGKKHLSQNKIDCLLQKSKNKQNSVVILVLKKESPLTLYIVETFSALQKKVEGNSINWISDINPIQDSGIQKQTLPTWILMLVLLVGFIILPAQVADEKEKKLLLALLQTPMREIEWLIAKLFLSMILIFGAVLFLHLLGNFDFGNVLSYVSVIAAGSFCFGSYGILLGFLCRTQASARTIGVIFYLPHLLPSALSDFSQKLTDIAPFLPSYQFYASIKSILLENGRISNLSLEWIYLLFVGLVTFSFSYLLIKKRWLM